MQSSSPHITAPRRSSTITVAVACSEGGWPHPNWLVEDDSIRVRHVHPPYEDLASSLCHVLLLRSREPAHDLPRLRSAMRDRSLPVLLVCPTADSEHITAVFGLGAPSTSFLVDGDCGNGMLAHALWSTVAGHTHLSPTAAAALIRGVSAHPGPTVDGAPLPQPLSRRERQVMDLLASGFRANEIGQRLSLTAKTVRNYLSSIYAKLGVTGATEAVLLWLHVRPRPARW